MSRRNQVIELPSDRAFGLFFSVLLGALSIYLYTSALIVYAQCMAVLTGVLFISAMLKPRTLRSLNRNWMLFGLILGKIVSPIVMGFIFFAIFSPIAIIMRIFKRDELRLRMQSRLTHWKMKDHSSKAADDFKNQF
jgi:flagellar biosynthesis protein FlhB